MTCAGHRASPWQSLSKAFLNPHRDLFSKEPRPLAQLSRSTCCVPGAVWVVAGTRCGGSCFASGFQRKEARVRALVSFCARTSLTTGLRRNARRGLCHTGSSSRGTTALGRRIRKLQARGCGRTGKRNLFPETAGMWRDFGSVKSCSELDNERVKESYFRIWTACHGAGSHLRAGGQGWEARGLCTHR